MGYDLTAVGEFLIDFAPKGLSANGLHQFAASPGGAPANVCAMFAKLGGRTAFVGKVGSDPFGAMLRNTLLDNGIAADGLIMDAAAPTSLAFVTLGEDGERDFCFYRKNSADTMLRPEELNREMLENSKFVHFGSVSLTDEPARSATFSAVELARAAGNVISYDPNYRPALWHDEDMARDMMLRGAALADIIKVSDEEAIFLTKTEDLEEASRILAAMGPSVVLITCGAEGVCYRTAADTGRIPGFSVRPVDTTGAGDTFMGTFLYCAKDMSPKEIAFLGGERMGQIMRCCNAAAAITTTGLGAIAAMPDMEQINSLLRAYAG